MKLHVQHRTAYRYSGPVTLAHNQARLTPRTFETQRCLFTQLQIEPHPTLLVTWSDFFGNPTTYFTMEEPHLDLSITMEAEVELSPQPIKAAAAHDLPWEQAAHWLTSRHDPVTLAATPFLYASPYCKLGAEVERYARKSFSPGRKLYEAVRELTQRIFTDFKYDPQATTINTTTEELFRIGRGVCQDFAHLQIACLRSVGLAARYVSGYLVTRPPPGKPKLIGSDASHAWLSVFFPELGWIDFDPTNNCLPTAEHITLAWGRDYFDIAPIKGLYLGESQSTLSVAVDVREVLS